ncbi:MAG: bifunctional (p)ppGpp synthetase/guanosine-3',5'-bis(diphosphate) 3'-pyrophosphohydrolase [Paracoccaceae bacterium]|nr:bifunctional (p)ppGpp synthetase/guanosine-3',5'-bis(diphosphate) 3'-pyrophosphohydrolase [Paracoccaceae bacterium]MDE2913117.1 bifunctional (p)ppGpp synthetase/guanosine-3',5'-bis(diphosphate) 3'-pyrophosphohydrolase [Paracoccaceae bacterium]
MFQEPSSDPVKVEDLVSTIKSYNPASDSELIRTACQYGRIMHGGQFRRSGEPYFTHPFAVASILAEQKLDDTTIVTALLHDVLEDTRSTHEDVSRRFGEEIAELVDGVTRLTNLSLTSIERQQAEDLRKLLMAMAKDARVIIVKLADRLHNMQTIRHQPPEKQQKKATETMDIYAPLAGRMGMQWMRDDLEDLAFKVLQPKVRGSILRRYVLLRQERGDLTSRIVTDIESVLTSAGITAEVQGRLKKPYSAWRKMEEKGQDFSTLSDVFGFRIITENVEDVYTVLGLMHRKWSSVPGRFKDYISQPKSNGYRSVHTTISGREGQRVEIQIRTKTMHEAAETGIAAHWSYRDGQRIRNPFSGDPDTWIKTLADALVSQEPHENLLEHVKLEMYNDQIFCFTPKGRVHRLPKGATPIDFAYQVHTDVGSTCAGAKVDGRRVPLSTQLKNGQTVEILTAQNERPSASWTGMVVTGRAKAAIRRALQSERRESEIRIGRELARIAMERYEIAASHRTLVTAASRFGFESVDQLLRQMGTGRISGKGLVRKLYPELLDQAPKGVESPCRIVGLPRKRQKKETLCCFPVPQDRIVGIAIPNDGIEVHVSACKALQKYERLPSTDWLDLQWAEGGKLATHKARFYATITNSAGVLGRVCTLIGQQQSNISNLEFTERMPDVYRMVFEIEVRDVAHLFNVSAAVKADKDVQAFERAMGQDPAEPDVSAP